MPYIKITEEDITPLASFDTVENAVLIFGFDFRKAKDAENPEVPEFQLFTDLNSFILYIKKNKKEFNDLTGTALRPFVTAYDCLANGLPVIYYPIDKFIPKEVLVNSEAIYELLSIDGELPPIIPESTGADFSDSYWQKVLGYTSEGDARFAYDTLNANKTVLDTAAEKALSDLLTTNEAGGGIADGFLLSDKVNMPFTFVTTCGFEDFNNSNAKYEETLMSLAGDRKDFVYLYDIAPGVEPAQLVGDNTIFTEDLSNKELVNIVYPWGHYMSSIATEALHMPGSYGYLMAYANSIRNNNPWFAAAGINRGVIPNIVDLDYKIREVYLHAWQGEETKLKMDNPLQFRINPIMDFGANYGKVIFGNRTNFIPSGAGTISFKSFLNVRLLLVYIHKQAFNSSIQHMFEPNDDIVWLSFKQKVNDLLDQMVSGRGLKWYKWYKLRPDKLGQIKARLTIRPIEAVESFDIIISMTDADIEVNEEYPEG